LLSSPASLSFSIFGGTVLLNKDYALVVMTGGGGTGAGVTAAAIGSPLTPGLYIIPAGAGGCWRFFILARVCTNGLVRSETTE